MAVPGIEQKILGRLAKQTVGSNVLLSESIFKVLGLSILLQESLEKTEAQRKSDTSLDPKLLKLHHHIIWLAREGLSITEVHILPYCQDGEQGPECRVMAAKLRAGFYHIFCRYHNNPSISQISLRSRRSGSSPPSALSPKERNGHTRRSPSTPPRNTRDRNDKGKRAAKATLRDPIPSMTSDTSYVTNPYAGLPSQTPPPAGPPPSVPPEARRTPRRPPGLTAINIPESQLAASFLLPPLNFVPLAKDHFVNAQQLATGLLPATHALRLLVALDYSIFLLDCAKDVTRSIELARRTIDEVYRSSEELTDEEFDDASYLVRSLASTLQKALKEAMEKSKKEQVVGAGQPASREPHFDRTIAVSPPQQSNSTKAPADMRSYIRTPERLSTVPEVESVDGDVPRLPTTSPPISRLSSRSRQRRRSSGASDKASKRRVVEQAEELHRKSNLSYRSNASGSSHSRLPTPQEGALRSVQSSATTQPQQQQQRPRRPADTRATLSKEVSVVEERRVAILSALDIIASVSRGLWVPDNKSGKSGHHRFGLT